MHDHEHIHRLCRKWEAKHVVLIAIDGWGAYSVPQADIPNIRKLMEKDAIH